MVTLLMLQKCVEHVMLRVQLVPLDLRQTVNRVTTITIWNGWELLVRAPVKMAHTLILILTNALCVTILVRPAVVEEVQISVRSVQQVS